MAEIRTYVCDVCGKQKGEANHWWKAFVVPEEQVIVFYPFGSECSSVANGVDIRVLNRATKWVDLCGQECANRKLAEFMQ